ncbi:MAG: hypothetical protein ACI87E_003968, partial [Mariniblastus sp.]
PRGRVVDALGRYRSRRGGFGWLAGLGVVRPTNKRFAFFTVACLLIAIPFNEPRDR